MHYLVRLNNYSFYVFYNFCSIFKKNKINEEWLENLGFYIYSFLYGLIILILTLPLIFSPNEFAETSRGSMKVAIAIPVGLKYLIDYFLLFRKGRWIEAIDYFELNSGLIEKFIYAIIHLLIIGCSFYLFLPWFID